MQRRIILLVGIFFFLVFDSYSVPSYAYVPELNSTFRSIDSLSAETVQGVGDTDRGKVPVKQNPLDSICDYDAGGKHGVSYHSPKSIDQVIAGASDPYSRPALSSFSIKLLQFYTYGFTTDIIELPLAGAVGETYEPELFLTIGQQPNRDPLTNTLTWDYTQLSGTQTIVFTITIDFIKNYDTWLDLQATLTATELFGTNRLSNTASTAIFNNGLVVLITPKADFDPALIDKPTAYAFLDPDPLATEQSIRYDYTIKLLGETSQNTQTFASKENDSHTGLMYFGARFYDPVIGRFISEDPVLGKTYDPLSLGRYPYGYNNPLRYVDPDGMVTDEINRKIWEFLMNVEPGAFDVFLSGYTSAVDTAGKPVELLREEFWEFIETGEGPCTCPAAILRGFLIAMGEEHGILNSLVDYKEFYNFVVNSKDVISALFDDSEFRKILIQKLGQGSKKFIDDLNNYNDSVTQCEAIGKAIWYLPQVVAGVKAGFSSTVKIINQLKQIRNLRGITAFREAAIKFLRTGKIDDTIEMTQATKNSVWLQGPGPRGELIKTAWGHNLPKNFKTWDRFENGAVTSIKSFDLSLPGYLDTQSLDLYGIQEGVQLMLQSILKVTH